MALLKASAVIGSLTLASRLLGFVREALLAAVLGAGWVSDCFFIAFKLPNLMRRLFAEGAFSSAFVPAMSRVLGEQGDARAFAEQVLSWMLVILLGLTTLAMLAMPLIVLALTGGFSNPQPGQLALTIELSRLTFPYLLLVSLVALLGGVLNSLSRFAAAAASPVLLNLVLIGALLLAPPSDVAAARAVSLALSLAGLAQLVWLLTACQRAGMVLRLVRPRLSPALARLGRSILPAAIGQGGQQISLLLAGVLAAWLLAPGAVSYLYFADRLAQLPLGVIGAAVGTALLPTLAKHLGAGDPDAANALLSRAVELTLLLALPAGLCLAALATPIVTLAYGRGAFAADDVQATAAVLIGFALGLPAAMLVKILTPRFYAVSDTRTPLQLALAGVALALLLCALLIPHFGAPGLAAALSLSAFANAIGLIVVLARRGWWQPDALVRAHALGMVLAALVTAGLCALTAHWLRGGAWLLLIIALSLPLYAGLCRLLGAGDVRALLKRAAHAA